MVVCLPTMIIRRFNANNLKTIIQNFADRISKNPAITFKKYNKKITAAAKQDIEVIDISEFLIKSLL